MSGGRPGGGRPRLVRVALFGLFRFCHPLRHDVLCSTWMGPGDRRYELRWIPSSPRSKGKPSFRILKMDFACLPPHPPRQGKAKFPDITLGLVLERGCRGACSGTALCLSMVPPGRKWIFRAGFRGVHTLFVSLCQGTCRCPRHDVQFRSLGVTTVCVFHGFRTRNNDSCQKRSSLGVGAIGGCAQQRCRKVCVHWPGVVQVRMSKTYSFPFGHVHWLCNSFFVMHVTHSASGREPLPPTTDSSTIFRRGAARGVVVDKCIGYAIRFL